MRSGMSRACLLQRNAFGTGRIFRHVHVEKGIDRLIRPIGDGDTMPRALSELVTKVEHLADTSLCAVHVPLLTQSRATSLHTT